MLRQSTPAEVLAANLQAAPWMCRSVDAANWAAAVCYMCMASAVRSCKPAILDTMALEDASAACNARLQSPLSRLVP